MNRHFSPRPSQIARDRAIEKQNHIPPEISPYEVKYWYSTRDWERSSWFFLTFRDDPGDAAVVEAMQRGFGELLDKVTRPWCYEVQLHRRLRWDEIKARVRAALLEVVR